MAVLDALADMVERSGLKIGDRLPPEVSLAATLGVDGEDLQAVAAVVLTLNGQFSVIGSALERVRAQANKSIDEAGTLAGITAAAQVVWPY